MVYHTRRKEREEIIMRGIFYELMIEASIGKVQIDENDFEIAFHTTIKGEKEKNLSDDDHWMTLVINDSEQFFELLEEYISLELKANRKRIEFYREKNKNTIKYIMSYLFVNATTEDFLKPEEMLKRRIDFLKDQTFDELKKGIDISLGPIFKGSSLHIQKEDCPISMETPYRLNFSLTRGKSNFPLPSIYYGISDGVCYLYGIQQPKERKRFLNPFEKEMNRVLYKINEGVPPKESNVYQNDENLVDVTHSFVLVLDIFTKLLKSRGIDQIKTITYLPVRYQAMEIFASNREKKREIQEENDRIQKNLTEKLIRTIRRLEYQDSSIEITSYPYEVDEYLTIGLKEKGTSENRLLQEIDESMKRR